jgi:hypothetical protein
MRRSLGLSMAAGCGQLFIAKADAYHMVGGHEEIKESLHDGVKLPRAFRSAGFMTGLFDATDLASVRMYHGARETWQGLGKNAIEGLGAPRLIGIMTIMLTLGQIAPWILLPFLSGTTLLMVSLSAAASLIPRIGGAILFKQPALSVVFHPIGVLTLLLIQWQAFFKWMLGFSSTWKGRNYGGSVETPNTPRTSEARI